MIHRYLRFPGGKGKALTFSYDDGVYEDIRLIEIFRKNGLLTTDNGRIALTKRGFLVSNGIIAQLVL